MYNSLEIIAYCDKAGSIEPVSILEAGVIIILIGSSPAVCQALRNSIVQR
jgi:hypothetical protein